ncbi:MAG: fumarylacetoacetate hydrolase family protein [Phenylobacterium sp.]|uniref:fumarylacetoacetate hydrolase family protein n=1 Tax=Brevundimonas sp. TaxID=1871086 RepID=UPI002737A6FB|nr:fumarylacetoacetate hydrolase family protein [Brevundimonas sp.]MDP3801851.1 fumarylacetoacetate hydrolase family protein [Brevundimonas sp.]MDZ4373264.1 fumarylacetoacetate hydrolase family protein [Phenylobacterium sp.]
MRLIDDMPADWRAGVFLGRLLLPEGPTPVLVRGGEVIDISRSAPTTAQAIAQGDAGSMTGESLGPLEALELETSPARSTPRLLSPLDLQCIKASGVTFAVSAVERVIEERARGDASAAQTIRRALADRVGADLSAVRPGSEGAEQLKAVLIEEGLWSQYLEVAIGKDAEIFTKAPVLASVGWGEDVGVRSDSAWNNPEPEVVLICNARGQAVGAALGNDVNLRDIEGRSALLLGKAKDNNASAAIGPWIRLFDADFGIEDVRNAVVSLKVTGEDGFELSGQSSMRLISRDPLDLAGQTLSPNHQYPDGFALYLGTMFAPIDDRDIPGQGFTHKQGDEVCVSSPRLGVLRNRVTSCESAPPWTFGIASLMTNLASRGLL